MDDGKNPNDGEDLHKKLGADALEEVDAAVRHNYNEMQKDCQHVVSGDGILLERRNESIGPLHEPSKKYELDHLDKQNVDVKVMPRLSSAESVGEAKEIVLESEKQSQKRVFGSD